MNIHNWVIKGTTEATSRYFKFIADIHILTYRVVANAMPMNSGSATIPNVGQI